MHASRIVSQLNSKPEILAKTCRIGGLFGNCETLAALIGRWQTEELLKPPSSERNLSHAVLKHTWKPNRLAAYFINGGNYFTEQDRKALEISSAKNGNGRNNNNFDEEYLSKAVDLLACVNRLGNRQKTDFFLPDDETSANIILLTTALQNMLDNVDQVVCSVYPHTVKRSMDLILCLGIGLRIRGGIPIVSSRGNFSDTHLFIPLHLPLSPNGSFLVVEKVEIPLAASFYPVNEGELNLKFKGPLCEYRFDYWGERVEKLQQQNVALNQTLYGARKEIEHLQQSQSRINQIKQEKSKELTELQKRTQAAETAFKQKKDAVEKLKSRSSAGAIAEMIPICEKDEETDDDGGLKESVQAILLEKTAVHLRRAPAENNNASNFSPSTQVKTLKASLKKTQGLSDEAVRHTGNLFRTLNTAAEEIFATAAAVREAKKRLKLLERSMSALSEEEQIILTALRKDENQRKEAELKKRKEQKAEKANRKAEIERKRNERQKREEEEARRLREEAEQKKATVKKTASSPATPTGGSGSSSASPKSFGRQNRSKKAPQEKAQEDDMEFLMRLAEESKKEHYQVFIEKARRCHRFLLDPGMQKFSSDLLPADNDQLLAVSPDLESLDLIVQCLCNRNDSLPFTIDDNMFTLNFSIADNNFTNSPNEYMKSIIDQMAESILHSSNVDGVRTPDRETLGFIEKRIEDIICFAENFRSTEPELCEIRNTATRHFLLFSCVTFARKTVIDTICRLTEYFIKFQYFNRKALKETLQQIMKPFPFVGNLPAYTHEYYLLTVMQNLKESLSGKKNGRHKKLTKNDQPEFTLFPVQGLLKEIHSFFRYCQNLIDCLAWGNRVFSDMDVNNLRLLQETLGEDLYNVYVFPVYNFVHRACLTLEINSTLGAKSLLIDEVTKACGGRLRDTDYNSLTHVEGCLIPKTCLGFYPQRSSGAVPLSLCISKIIGISPCSECKVSEIRGNPFIITEEFLPAWVFVMKLSCDYLSYFKHFVITERIDTLSRMFTFLFISGEFPLAGRLLYRIKSLGGVLDFNATFWDPEISRNSPPSQKTIESLCYSMESLCYMFKVLGDIPTKEEEEESRVLGNNNEECEGSEKYSCASMLDIYREDWLDVCLCVFAEFSELFKHEEPTETDT
jgi:hypothetical protein